MSVVNRLGIPLPAGRTKVTQGTGTLIIKKMIPADSGLYECTATNTMGTKRALLFKQRVVLVNTVPQEYP